jgi:hypothetical protein
MTPTKVLPPPLTGRLWARLKRLDKRCYMAFSRTRPNWCQEFRHLPLVWYATIAARDRSAHERVNIEHPEFGEAVRLAVEEAEAKRWHLPAP